MNNSDTIRVLLIENHNLLREAFRLVLESEGGFIIAGEGSGPLDVLELIETHRPDVVMLMMDGTGEREFALLQGLRDFAERARVLVVTGDPDPALHAQAIELGAMGVVMKDQSVEVLAKALRKVYAGEIWLDRARTAMVLNRLTRRRVEVDPETAKVESLTPREQQIVALITEGLSNKDIAERLRISEATARNHLTSILAKLELADRFQLTVYAFRRGLVVCPQTPAMLRIATTMSTASPLRRATGQSRRWPA